MPVIFGPTDDPSGTGWDAHMLAWDAAYAARVQETEAQDVERGCETCFWDASVHEKTDEKCEHCNKCLAKEDFPGWQPRVAKDGGTKIAPDRINATLDKLADGGHVWNGVEPRDLRGEPADWWRTGTCGECAFRLEKPWTDDFGIPSRKCMTTIDEPACPAGVRR